MSEHPQHHPVARAVRVARAYAGMSRAQLGRKIGVHPGTVGRWERGDWRKDPPKDGMLQAVANHTKIRDFLAAGDIYNENDPIRRFADATHREAERQRARPPSEPKARADEDAEDEDG